MTVRFSGVGAALLPGLQVLCAHRCPPRAAPLSGQGPFRVTHPPPRSWLLVSGWGPRSSSSLWCLLTPAAQQPLPAATIADPGPVWQAEGRPGPPLTAIQPWLCGLGPQPACGVQVPPPAGHTPPMGLWGTGRGRPGPCRCGRTPPARLARACRALSALPDLGGTCVSGVGVEPWRVAGEVTGRGRPGRPSPGEPGTWGLQTRGVFLSHHLHADARFDVLDRGATDAAL